MCSNTSDWVTQRNKRVMAVGAPSPRDVFVTLALTHRRQEFGRRKGGKWTTSQISRNVARCEVEIKRSAI